MARKDKGISLNAENTELSGQQVLEQKKKKKKRKIVITVIIIVVVVLALIAGIAVFAITKATKSMMGGTVSLGKPTRDSLTSELSITGTTKSQQTIHYYAPATLQIESVVPAGTYVKKGELILKFDQTSYDNAMREVEINGQIGENSYNSIKATEQTKRNKVSKAQAEIDKAQAEVNEKQALVDEAKKRVDNYEYNSNLEHSQSAIETQIAYEQANIAKCQAQLDALKNAFIDSDEYRALNSEEKVAAMEAFLSQGEPKELADSVAYSQTVIANVSKMAADQNVDYTKAKTDYTKYQSELEVAKSKLESAKSSLELAKDSVGNSYDRENSELNEELTEMQFGSNMNELKKYEKGLVAPFNGVVTAIGYDEGDKAMANTMVATFSSLSDVNVILNVNKTDLAKIELNQPVTVKVLNNEYKGHVSNINRAATINQSGSTQIEVAVTIDNPDDNMFIGLESKCTIVTASIDECLQVPVESVNVDNVGDFVYTIDPSTLVVGKKYVTTGASSDFFIEIKDGVTEDDVIVTTYTGTLTEGMPAMVSPDSKEYLTVGK